ncbi:ACP S-malonyltransferase [Campylobacter sp.]|uniref:ACP S-malonyltransferase n=1 Tax=Campylobacter sp. TaxID=205 RepID=UPI002A58F0FF|nr:ACP S-malonyltransferase [Campylobacter sp.]MDD7091420.1 ACP S-malonyltransferase [Campylobacteraceae bacterium]MDY5286042.1 ACP S-malonyltransferase [Campylobacter sp.]
MNLAFIFPGQGCQKAGMAKEFYDNFKGAKELLDSASDELKIDFKKIMFEGENLDISEFTQPAILLASHMTLSAFKESFSAEARALLGHSLGEFSALVSAGAFSINEALKIVNKRGQFMAIDCEGKGAGMMVILGLDDEKIEQICASSGLSAYPANYNCDGQLVIAGLKDDLSALEGRFKEAGAKRAMLLNMSVASHCPLLQNASAKLRAELESVLKPSFAPVISNATAGPYDSKEKALELLQKQLTSPVLYKQSIKACESKIDAFIEFGSSVLSGLNKKISAKSTYSVFDMASLEATLSALKG